MPPLSSLRGLTAGDGLIVAVVLALFAGPALILAVGDRPSPFGFQMYSGYGEVTVTWRDSTGIDHQIELADHVASPRWEIDWPETLPEALCPRLPRAVSVEVRQARAARTVARRVTC